MFAVSFEEIATIVGRTPEAARQLASRARRRVQGGKDRREGASISKEKLLKLSSGRCAHGISRGWLRLDPEVVVRIDEAAARPGAAREIHGAHNFASGAIAFSHFAEAVEPMLVDGAVWLVWAPHGQLARVLRFTLISARISGVEIIADPRRLEGLDLAVLPE